ncbi:hypothetical protein HPB49_025287 [Dermacentor silvarum]|uniref:Uncharacterized protein n=1 Tax=Dermacentor silvarum TaxID=543639 RepID=A0ACB8DLP2_DERSI|nr:hypothetical protein HPB49_025287 [Dermacentor silvarum]
MRGEEAAKLAKDLHLFRVPEVRGKADLTRYRDAGAEVLSVLCQFSEVVERASIDEAYLDLTEACKGVPLPQSADALANTSRACGLAVRHRRPRLPGCPAGTSGCAHRADTGGRLRSDRFSLLRWDCTQQGHLLTAGPCFCYLASFMDVSPRRRRKGKASGNDVNIGVPGARAESVCTFCASVVLYPWPLSQMINISTLRFRLTLQRTVTARRTPSKKHTVSPCRPFALLKAVRAPAAETTSSFTISHGRKNKLLSGSQR